IAFNKWDLIEDRQMVLADLYEKTARLLPQVRGIRAVPISGERGQGIDKLMENVVKTHEIWNRRISTGRLNRWLTGVIAHQPPPAVSGRRSEERRAGKACTSQEAAGEEATTQEREVVADE